MRMPLVAGRDSTVRDRPATEQVILINQTMARQLFPGQNAIGQIIQPDKDRRVVGIVGDVRHLALEQSSGSEMYIPVRQTGDYASVDLVLRTTLPPAELASAVRGSLKSIAPNLPRTDFRTLQQLIDRAVSPRRFVVMLLGGFALLALLLASLGIYGVVSYSVTQRSREIGIRMALGASAGHVQFRVLRETVGLALIGILVGLAGSAGVSRLLESLLFGVKPGDAATFVAMTLVLTSVAALAGYLPARRASRIDPMAALRSE